jgi:hypothetical protein
MSLRLYMDEHVPSAVTAELRKRGIDVVTAQQDGYSERMDDEVLDRATSLGRVVFTQDEDYLAIANRWQRSLKAFVGIVYGHQLDLTIGATIEALELICQAMSTNEIQNRVIFYRSNLSPQKPAASLAAYRRAMPLDFGLEITQA